MKIATEKEKKVNLKKSAVSFGSVTIKDKKAADTAPAIKEKRLTKHRQTVQKRTANARARTLNAQARAASKDLQSKENTPASVRDPSQKREQRKFNAFVAQKDRQKKGKQKQERQEKGSLTAEKAKEEKQGTKTNEEKSQTVFQNTAHNVSQQQADSQNAVQGINSSTGSSASSSGGGADGASLAIKTAGKAKDELKKMAQSLKNKSTAIQQPQGPDEQVTRVQKVQGMVMAVATTIISALSVILAPIMVVIVAIILVVCVIIVVVGVITALIVFVISIFTSSIDGLTDNEYYIYSFFEERNYGDTQIAAILGNLKQELSSMDATYDTGTVIGIMQWTGSQRTAFINWCEDNEYDPYTLEAQCEYMDQTFLETTWNFANYSGDAAYSEEYDITFEEWLALDESDIDLATGAFCACAERPYYYNSLLDENRIPYARNYLAIIQSGSLAVGDPPTSSDIEYLQAAFDMASDDSIGYSMVNRLKNPDVDCSSFIAYALKEAGYDISPASFTTANAVSVLTALGFEKIDYSLSALREGDILWYRYDGDSTGHMEIYAGNGYMVGAHTSTVNGVDYPEGGDQTGQEVSVVEFNDEGGWIYIFREAS